MKTITSIFSRIVAANFPAELARRIIAVAAFVFAMGVYTAPAHAWSATWIGVIVDGDNNAAEYEAGHVVGYTSEQAAFDAAGDACAAAGFPRRTIDRLRDDPSGCAIDVLAEGGCEAYALILEDDDGDGVFERNSHHSTPPSGSNCEQSARTRVQAVCDTATVRCISEIFSYTDITLASPTSSRTGSVSRGGGSSGGGGGGGGGGAAAIVGGLAVVGLGVWFLSQDDDAAEKSIRPVFGYTNKNGEWQSEIGLRQEWTAAKWNAFYEAARAEDGGAAKWNYKSEINYFAELSFAKVQTHFGGFANADKTENNFRLSLARNLGGVELRPSVGMHGEGGGLSEKTAEVLAEWNFRPGLAAKSAVQMRGENTSANLSAVYRF